MASFTDYITVEGERMLAKAVAGETISFTKIVVGSGYLPSGTIEKNVNAVVNPKAEIPIQSVSVNATDSVLISAHFSNKELEHGFYFREKAMYMSDGIDEVLAIYGNNGSSAEYIDTAEVCIVDKTIKSVVKLSSQELANINIVDDTYEFAPVLEPDIKTINEFVKKPAAMAMKVGQRVILNRWTAYTYIGYDPTDVSCYITGANVLSDTYKEKLANGSAKGGVGASQNALYEVYGIANRALEGIALHLEDKDNPHNVTKKQVGLGDVPNVPTNDQTPTYTAASSNANLTSGEKLSVAFGKIAKAISSLISHLANTSNPHGVTKAQVGLGNCNNTSDANKPISTATQKALDGKSDTSHTHNYAGSSSEGGSATSAVKLDSSAGSVTQPVYFSNGKPVDCKYSLGDACRYGVSSNPKISETGLVPTSHAVANALSTKLGLRNICNNLTTTSSGYVLDARQGKALGDRVSNLETWTVTTVTNGKWYYRKVGTVTIDGTAKDVYECHYNGSELITFKDTYGSFYFNTTSIKINLPKTFTGWMSIQAQAFSARGIYTVALNNITNTQLSFWVGSAKQDDGSVNISFDCLLY